MRDNSGVVVVVQKKQSSPIAQVLISSVFCCWISSNTTDKLLPVKMALKVYYDLMSQPSRAVYMFLKIANIPFESHLVKLREGTLPLM